MQKLLDTPQLLGDMTDAEIGALVRAHNGGETIQRWHGSDWVDNYNIDWAPFEYYRIKPKPVREPVTLFCGSLQFDPECDFGPRRTYGDTHKITFDLINGEPDTSSIQMEKLND